MTTPHTHDEHGVSPAAEILPITLHLTPVQFGVVVALAGIGLSAMTENVEMARDYRDLLSRPETADEAFAAFASLVQTLGTVTGRAA